MNGVLSETDIQNKHDADYIIEKWNHTGANVDAPHASVHSAVCVSLFCYPCKSFQAQQEKMWPPLWNCVCVFACVCVCPL